MKTKYSLYLFIVLTTLYLAVALATPPEPDVLARYNITENGVRLLSLTILVPLVFAWSALFYGSYKLKYYAHVIDASKDGKAFKDISTGLMIMVFSFPTTALMSSLVGSYVRSSPELISLMAVLRNYINLVFPLIAFYMIGRGAKKLHALLKRRSMQYSSKISLLFIFISSAFTWHVMSQVYAPHNSSNTYNLPIWLVVLTIILPYLYTWHIGVVAAMQIYQYQATVKGVVYQKALKFFVAGLLAIIGLSILMQFILASTERLNRLNLSPVLVMLYAIVFLNVVAYGLVAIGAKRLTMIEET